MKRIDRDKLVKLMGALLVVAFVCTCTVAMADVGNQNRYVDTSSGGDDDLFGFIAGLVVGLLFEHPVVGIPVLLIILFFYLRARRKAKNGGGSAPSANRFIEAQPEPDQTVYMPQEVVVAQIQAIDPNFSAEKFTAWVREVFIKLQQAWSDRDWKKIRPFESEELFSLHNSQLEEYIRGNKINMIEKIGVKACSLVHFGEDGDKEVVKVRLSAVMRDYVIDATTRKVLESDPNKDWYMTYIMTFNRKKGVKTHAGLSNMSTTNCPNCGAPTEITSAGQCPYCGSVITTGENDWVLSDIHSI